MLISTKGIVLQTVKYSENSVIAHIYTRQLGLKSYMVKSSSGSKKGKSNHRNFFQPLSVLDLVVYNKPSGGLQHIKETRFAQTFSNIAFCYKRMSVLLFLHEVLCKCLKEEIPNEECFDFIENSLCLLDQENCQLADFHLYFLLKMSSHLGFLPLSNFSVHCRIFNLPEGRFESFIPEHSHYLDERLSFIFSEMLFFSNGESKLKPILSHTDKKTLLSKIIDFYGLHIAGFKNISSHKILEEMFDAMTDEKQNS